MEPAAGGYQCQSGAGDRPLKPLFPETDREPAGATLSERLKNAISVYDFVRRYVDLDENATGYCPFHDDEHKESDVDVEVWEQVAAPFTPAGDVRCVEVPEREVAMAVLRGSYDGIGAVFQELGTWVSRNDVRIVGPAINIYRVSPAQDSDPAHWVTEVCLPIG